jgi:hypothetical protein
MKFIIVIIWYLPLEWISVSRNHLLIINQAILSGIAFFVWGNDTNNQFSAYRAGDLLILIFMEVVSYKGSHAFQDRA